MVKLLDPLAFLKETRDAAGETSAAAIVNAAAATKYHKDQVLKEAQSTTSLSSEIDPAKKDFRVFLTMIWRHLLGNDPNPIQLDMAYWLQHGPDRAIIMAFRGFSKSWITGAYALWRLKVNPEEKIMVVSGSLARAVATSSWCLGLVMTMEYLKELRPKANNRQSGQKWDVGCVIPAQSASFTAFGIGGQLVGFRGSLIIPDDVETQTNSLTIAMQEKIEEAVKEFESVLTPGGQIKYLGTPHTENSLYMKLLRLRDPHGKPVYEARIWPALYPTTEQIKAYRGMLAPYITHMLDKLGPVSVGHSTMPMRFTDDDLMKRKAAMGSTEFTLQFMLDLSGSLLDKYPLKLRDLIVMDLALDKGPEDVTWGTMYPDRDLPVMGLDGDFFYKPAEVGTQYAKYQKIHGYIDNSGRGDDETTLNIGGLLYARAFWLDMFASKDGYGPTTLTTIADRCVLHKVQRLYIESNYGDGMFTSLLRPVLIKAWEVANRKRKNGEEHGGTELIEVKSKNNAQKEKKVLAILEPVTQAHRLIVNRKVIEYDDSSIRKMEGEDSRHRYAWGYQYTHITKERDCLGKDDRVEGLSGLLATFAEDLGVDPLNMALQAKEDRDAWLMRELEEMDEAEATKSGRPRHDDRAVAARIHTR